MKKVAVMKEVAMKTTMVVFKMNVPAKGKKWQVFKGTRAKSQGGLTKKNLVKNKRGRVVSKKKSALGKKNAWTAAMGKARKSLGITGFQAVGGKTRKGKEFLAMTREFHKQILHRSR